MKMRIAPPNEGLQAVVRGTDVIGASIGSAEGQAYLTLGWHSLQRMSVVAESTAIRYEWPSGDFACVRVGSEFPFDDLPDGLACVDGPSSGASAKLNKENVR